MKKIKYEEYSQWDKYFTREKSPLEALEEVKHLRLWEGFDNKFEETKEYEIIELELLSCQDLRQENEQLVEQYKKCLALKDKYQLENAKLRMKNATLRQRFGELDDRCCNLFLQNQENEKRLKTIRDKNVCIHDLKKSKTLEEYNGCREWEEELTQQEYDLLKEVLL